MLTEWPISSNQLSLKINSVMHIRTSKKLVATVTGLVISLAGAPGAASAAVFLTMHQFGAVAADGAYPRAPMLQGADGNYYGVTHGGGLYGAGTVFQMTPAGVTTVLHQFDTVNGSGPTGITELASGDLVGATYAGGANSSGVVFRLTKTGYFTVLHTLNGTTEGASVAAPLFVATNGVIYGATSFGTSASGTVCGTVFAIGATNVFSIIHSFADSTNGCSGKGTMLSGNTDAYLYGTAEGGGAYNQGVLYSIVPGTGVFTRLASFGASSTAGKVPKDGLVQGPDHNLYGVTYGGGAMSCSYTTGCGTIFKYTLSSRALTTLFNFSDNNNSNASYGAYPHGPLAIGRDGLLHGVTEGGGYTAGVVYSVGLTGANYAVSHYFIAPTGSNPMAGLIQGSSGLFYGSTSGGSGSSSYGTIFETP